MLFQHKAGNESSIASDSFTFDTTNPTATLDNIPDFANSLTAISGTAADSLPGQVNKVQIQIKNTADNTYWNVKNLAKLHSMTKCSHLSMIDFFYGEAFELHLTILTFVGSITLTS